ncbi:hypothetical protein O3M35_012012 [Rhynocoris fuscipes]|uniref:Uncharacterized protein n=1 Tax=Rhynocoris fuscipes TaxID=488301 RepID=A0AAW1CYU8_9HEMI
MKYPKVNKTKEEEFDDETNADIEAILKPAKKKRKKPLVEDSEPEPETDSETEALQEAFKQGILKPGLNIPVPENQKPKINNVPLLKKRLEEIKLDLDWVERLDIISKPAPIAPELSVQLNEAEKTNDTVVHDELKRESIFYRQAQDAVLSVLPKLRELGIKTQRPEDYYAEMAKTDSHMQKVKLHLIKRKTEEERREKVRAVRAQKKLQKALQAQAKVAKQSAKKELMDQVKKFRKGQTKDLSFLEGPAQKKQGQPVQKKQGSQNKKSELKRRYKDSKFGFGGKKRGLKRNTKDSTAGIEKPKQKGKMPMKRPGKNIRKKMKGKKK